ncbi:hypothetical protein PSAC2689_40187 [Paraburkholderia sacchari]
MAACRGSVRPGLALSCEAGRPARLARGWADDDEPDGRREELDVMEKPEAGRARARRIVQKANHKRAIVAWRGRNAARRAESARPALLRARRVPIKKADQGLPRVCLSMLSVRAPL